MHQQNGKVEQKHLHIVVVGLTLLAQANLPLEFWLEAFDEKSVYLINRLPSSTIQNNSPHMLFYNSLPNYSYVKTFGCACFLNKSYDAHKLEKVFKVHLPKI